MKRGANDALYVSGIFETRIYDIHDPRRPKQVRSLLLPLHRDFAVYGTRLFRAVTRRGASVA